MLPTASVTEQPKGRKFTGELVLAPLSARGTPWMRRLGVHSDAFASGLMRVRGVRRQRAYDRGFVLSDHADWPALLETISAPAPRACSPRTATPSRSPAIFARRESTPGSCERRGRENRTVTERSQALGSAALGSSDMGLLLRRSRSEKVQGFLRAQPPLSLVSRS